MSQWDSTTAETQAPTELAKPVGTTGRVWLFGMLAIIAGMFLVRGLAPSDLLDNDQLKPAGYLLDIVIDGHWLVQTDFPGNIASKPPLHAWVAALAAFALGPTEWALAIPGAIGMLLGCLAIWMITAQTLGSRVAWLGSLAWLFSFFGFKHVWLARTDALYAGLTAIAIALAWRAATGSPNHRLKATPDHAEHHTPARGFLGPWAWVWLVLALATLTKGPLAVLFVGFAGLGLAIMTPRRRMVGGHLIGIITLLTLAGGWFAAALLFGGQAVYDKLIGDELLGHAVGASKEHLQEITLGERIWEFARGLFKPTLYAIWHTMPWSVAWVIGAWRAANQPSREPIERRMEFMCLAWLGLGILVLSVVPHQRPDHLLPLIPAAAILAGREVARWIEHWSAARCRFALLIATTVVLSMGWLNYGVLARNEWYIRHSEALAQLADEIHARDDIEAQRIVFVDASPGLQFLLRNNTDRISMEEAAERLASGDTGLFAIRDAEAFRDHFLRSGGDPAQLVVAAHITARSASKRGPQNSEDAIDGTDYPATLRGSLVIILRTTDAAE